MLLCTIFKNTKFIRHRSTGPAQWHAGSLELPLLCWSPPQWSILRSTATGFCLEPGRFPPSIPKQCRTSNSSKGSWLGPTQWHPGSWEQPYVSWGPPQRSLPSCAAVGLCVETGRWSPCIPKLCKTSNHHSCPGWAPPSDFQVNRSSYMWAEACHSNLYLSV